MLKSLYFDRLAGFVLINNFVCQWNCECNGFEQQLQRERERGPVRHGEIMPARYRTTLRKGANRDKVFQILTVGYIRE